MKYLENSTFDKISSALNFENGVFKIVARLESYSCKLVAEEKKLYKVKLNEEWKDQNGMQALSPPERSFVFPSCSPPLAFSYRGSSDADNTISSKTLFYLIATLNASFCPDYDFSQTKSDEFSRVPDLNWAKSAIDDCLYASGHEQYAQIQPWLWEALDQEIVLSDCDIYSFNPDLEPFTDEDGSHCLWSFHYFFYNRKLKRIVFFSCKSIRSAPSFLEGDREDEEEDFVSMDIAA